MPDYSRKLIEDQVQHIRYMYWVTGRKQCDIADYFPVTASQVSQIIRRKSWPHLPKVENEPN